MSKLAAYFSTDWSAMTASDWVGLVMNVVVFFLMIVLYFYVFKPANKEGLEAHRHIVLGDDSSEREDVV